MATFARRIPATTEIVYTRPTVLLLTVALTVPATRKLEPAKPTQSRATMEFHARPTLVIQLQVANTNLTTPLARPEIHVTPELVFQILVVLPLLLVVALLASTVKQLHAFLFQAA